MEQYNAQVAAAEVTLNAWTGIASLMEERNRAVREQREAEQRERDQQAHDAAVAQVEEQKRMAAEKAKEQAEVGSIELWNDERGRTEERSDQRQGDLAEAGDVADNGVSEWYQNLRLSGELDQNNSPFILSPNGQIDFGQITEAHHLPAAPIRLSMGDMTNGYIHINRRHGKQIQKAGFGSIESFVDYVVKNFTRIKEGASYKNKKGGKNNTYLIQLQDGHNNTLFVQLSRDGKYWNVNSAGVFGKKYGDKKEEIWSASEVQNDNSAVASDGLQSEPIAENGSTSNGTPSKNGEYNRHATVKQPVETAETSQDAELGDTQTSSRMNVPTSSGSKATNNQSTLQGNGEKSSVQERNVETDAAIEEEISRKLEDDAELSALREKLGDVEDMWEKRIDDYLVEHFPNGYDGTRARTEEQQALHDAERKAAKEDAVLKKMREDAKAEFDAVDAELSAAYKRREEFYRKEAETKRETDNNESRLQKAGGEAEMFAEKHGVEVSDVETYENAMKQGNVQSAHWALGNIRRTMRIKNRALKLSEFKDVFAEVRNELYERFGNLDELQREYEEKVMAERNAMEAARKKAEEEAAERQKHLDELSLLSDEEIDKRYMDAIDKGDETAAREMLDEAARRKGYADAESDYQGEGAWSAPSNPGYESDEARRADVEDNAPDVNLEDMALGYTLQPDDYFTHPERYSQDTPHGKESTKTIQEAIDALKRGEKDVKVKVYRAVPLSVKEGKLRNGDWVTPSRKYADMHGNSRLEGKYRIIEDEVPAKDLWWDGNDANEFGYDNGKRYRYKNTKNNRKLNDLVTRDDKGNVIPPSKRFNSRKADERYHRSGKAAPVSKNERVLRDALDEHLSKNGMEVIGTEEGQRVLDMANGENVRLEAKHRSERAEKRNRVLSTVDEAVSIVTGKPVKDVRAERKEREAEYRMETKELYDAVLSGDFNDVTLQRINDYLDHVTPLNEYGRPLSKRLPPEVLRGLRKGERTSEVDVLFSRISESSVPAHERTRAEGKRRIEEKKKELLKGWAIATGNWHTSVADFTSDTEPIGSGKDSVVYQSDDGRSVIKVSAGKDNLRKFRPDIDAVTLFNHIFRYNPYKILGYGEVGGKFVKFLEQPIVDFSDSTPLSAEERVRYMEGMGFQPMNEERTAFSNGKFVVADLQGNNIVKDKSGNVRVIDADVKLHTKDMGGKWTYPDVETDTGAADHARFFRTKDGEAYGFTVGGRIYYDPRIATSETLVHEYAHLWASALRGGNAEEWKNVVGLMKGTSVWDEVKRLYPELKMDDEIADEVIAQYSGRRGAERLREEAKRIAGGNGGVFEKAEAISALEKVKRALSKFWKGVCDMLHIHYTSAEEVADRVMKDLLDGVDPRKFGRDNALRMQEEAELKKVNEAFNQRLDELVADPNQKDRVLRLGHASSFLKDGGVADADIELEFDRFVRKSGEKYKNHHPFNVIDLKDLPMAIANPIAIFNSTNANDHVVLTELQKDGKNFIVAIRAVEQHRKGGVVLEVNQITSLYPKEEKGIVNWINTGRISNVDKEKALHFIEALQPHAGTTITSEELNSAANVIQSFETTKGTDGNRSFKNDKTLVGVHNITEEKLRKALKLGGFANPSLAVIDTDKNAHNGFGEISFIAPSALIGKRTGRNAGTFFGDAWTPTYPTVERQMSVNGSKKATQDVMSVPKEMQGKVRMGIDRYLDSGDANSGLAYLFLHERGEAPAIQKTQTVYDDKVYEELKLITSGNFNIRNIGKADMDKLLNMYIDAKYGGDRAAYEQSMQNWLEKNKAYVEAGTKEGMRFAIAKQNVEIYDEYGFNFKSVQSFVNDVNYDHRRGGKADLDGTLKTADDYVLSNDLIVDFGNWLNGKDKEYEVKEVIFDGFTPSGKRKYVPNDLEHVSKIMKKQGLNGASGQAFAFNNFVAVVMEKTGALDKLRKRKDMLTNNHDDTDRFTDKWATVFNELAEILNPNSKELFDDAGYYRLAEVALMNNPKEYVKKEYGVDLTDKDIDKMRSLVEAIRKERPTMYFETKFERPVHLNEFAAVVVPNNLGADVRKGLEESGLRLYEYDAKKEGDRQRAFDEAINSGDGIRFQFVGERGAEAADRAEEVTTRLDNLGVAREMEEAKKGKEIFNDFYTNRKASSFGTSNTSEEAHTSNDNALSAAKVVENFENPKVSAKNVADEGMKSRLLEDDDPKAQEANNEAMTERVNELAERLHTPVRIIRTDEEVASLPSARQRRMKGSFNPMTGEVTIVVPNNANMADVENTFVHEVVGHDGLRVLFPEEEKLAGALDELYRVSNEGIRQTIDRMAQRMYDAEVDRLREKKRREHEAKGEDANAHYYTDMAEAHVEASKKREQFKRDATEEY